MGYIDCPVSRGSSGGGEAVGAVFGLVGGLVGAIMIERRRRKQF